MAIKTDEDLLTVFVPIMEEVVEAIMERAKKLLQQHINADTYGIGRNNMGGRLNETDQTNHVSIWTVC